MSGPVWFLLFCLSGANLFVIGEFFGVPGVIIGQAALLILAVYLRYFREKPSDSRSSPPGDP